VKVLAGDIGGTNARLAIVDVAAGAAQITAVHRFATQDSPDLAPLVMRFLKEAGAAPERACLGIAGPVVDGDCRAPNLPWHVNARVLAADIGIPGTRLVNDFDAAAHGLTYLRPADLVTLQAGRPVVHGTIALIGAGTGLGEGFLVWDGERYQVHASEGGHASFAATDPVQWGLRAALGDEFGHVSYERVLSGPGLVRIYRHLAAAGGATPPPEVLAEMEREDPAEVVSRHALAGTDPLAVRSLDLFVSVFGAQAGNLALTVLATGGVYVAGGIAPRIVDKLTDGTFLTAFRAKGRLSDLVARVPVQVVVNPDLGLLGAAAAAMA
jgi:glucokinase